MTDRELLELAAKAAGVKTVQVGNWVFAEYHDYLVGKWNPLTDDGDALRLAVRLGLTITIDNNLGGETEAWRYAEHHIDVSQPHNNDPYAATRRAIVRAAAEIAKEMK